MGEFSYLDESIDMWLTLEQILTTLYSGALGH